MVLMALPQFGGVLGFSLATTWLTCKWGNSPYSFNVPFQRQLLKLPFDQMQSFYEATMSSSLGVVALPQNHQPLALWYI